MSLIAVLFISFFGLCLLGVPIAMSLALSALITGLLDGIPPLVIVQNMFTVVDSYTLLAVPLFLLVGEIMDQGSITERLVAFARSVVGHIRGGLGHVTVFSNMIMAGISGSGTADAAALGSIMIPAMKKEGYPGEMAVAINASAATMGPIIPPSIIMVVYGAYGGVSIAGLFLGGAIPGIIVGITLMITIYFWATAHNFPTSPRSNLAQIFSSFAGSIWALIVPFIIVLGIVGGIFTATESAMVAAVYSLLISIFIYRTLNMRISSDAFKKTLVSLANPLLAVAGSGAFAYIMAYLQVPDLILDIAGPVVGSKYATLIFITILYLILGTFMDAIPAIVIFLPIVQQLTAEAGLNPIHVGVLVTVVLCFGFLTPPYGLTLLLSAGIGKVPVINVLRTLVPFYLVMLGVIAILIFLPDIILFLPRLLVPTAVGG
ncbi:MAG TPA: TRAP transporter large permease [Thermoanaerobacterium sp.]|uniref:TRAP transporter large permease subunit n=1 Tax=Desulfofundulus thermobenzoicus TaxID=29376 RepID=A0A6N7IWF1_9FIRM|nr:TRAP transporter large permease subunit [Desulfofundulus thermobenzoicus]HHV75638.1 TRAP transporter large permease [Thermoanaerobacterium sp.]